VIVAEMPRASVHADQKHAGTKQSDRYIRKSTSTPTFKVIRKPDAWREGWQNHPTQTSGPRWTTGKFTFVRRPGKSDAEDEKFRSTGEARLNGRPPTKANDPGFRETYFQQKSREFLWVPGPGSYRTEREFMLPDSPDDVDTNKTVQEAAPEFSFGRELKETKFHIKKHEYVDQASKTSSKFMRNHGSYPKNDDAFTPGPGTYNQFTSFGAASGGSRRHYLGGVRAHGWEKKHRGIEDDTQ